MQSVFANTIIASGGRLVNAALGVVVVAIITRQLGASGYGIFVLLLSFGTIIQLLSDSGLYLTLSKEISQTQSHSRLFSQVLALRLGLLVAAFLAGAVMFPIIPSLQGWLPVYWILALGLACQSLSQLTVSVFQYRSEIWRATLGDLVGRAIQIFLLLWLWQAYSSITLVALFFTISSASSLLIHQILLPHPFKLKPQFDWLAWRRLLAVSWPLGLMLVLNAIYFRIDTLILSLYWDPSEVGQYGVAYRIIESSLFFSAMFGGLLLPKISAAVQKADLKIAQQYLNEGLQFLLALVVPLALMLSVLSQAIINIIAGPGYQEAASLLAWLALALVIMYFGNLFGFTLVALGRQRTLLKLSAFLVLFNTVANFILVPTFGAAAAAWTTILTELIAAGTAGLLVYRAIPFFLPWQVSLKSVGVGVTGMAFLFLINELPPFVQVSLGALVFVILTWLVRIVSKQHLVLLRTT